MPSSFKIYIDESGDEGFVFRPDGGGSSRWFVLSAIVMRHETDHLIVEAMKQARKLVARGSKHALHFVKLPHAQRLAWVQLIAAYPIRCASVLIHKPSIADPEVFKANAYQLYRYASRLLMERVSWFCRDTYNPKRGDGSAEIVFSNRRRMSYAEIQDYWRRLKSANEEKDIRIVWKHIDPDKVSAVNHDQLAGLQVADCVASAHFHAVSLDRFGNCEPRYFQELVKLLYRYKRTCDGYGLKFWPRLQTLRPSNAHLSIFDGL